MHCSTTGNHSAASSIMMASSTAAVVRPAAPLRAPVPRSAALVVHCVSKGGKRAVAMAGAATLSRQTVARTTADVVDALRADVAVTRDDDGTAAADGPWTRHPDDAAAAAVLRGGSRDVSSIHERHCSLPEDQRHALQAYCRASHILSAIAIIRGIIKHLIRTTRHCQLCCNRASCVDAYGQRGSQEAEARPEARSGREPPRVQASSEIIIRAAPSSQRRTHRQHSTARRRQRRARRSSRPPCRPCSRTWRRSGSRDGRSSPPNCRACAAKSFRWEPPPKNND